MRLVSGFCIRNVLDETIAVPTQEAAHCLSGLVSLNETGKFLFELLQSEQTRDSLIRALMDEYEVDVKTAAAGVDDFLKILEENHLITSGEEPENEEP